MLRLPSCSAIAVLLASLGAGAQTSSAPPQAANPETQVRQAYPAEPARIPLTAPDGTTTTLGAVAPRVLLVAPFTSRFGDLAELKLAPHLLQALQGQKDVAFIALNVDRPGSPEDWSVLREVLQERGVDPRLYSDARLAFFAWVNGPPEPGQREMLRLPSLAIVLDGQRLHGVYGLDPSATPETYVAERLAQVREALKAAGVTSAPAKAARKRAPKTAP
ncbi:hypothetical protein [Melittangium boletus]|uniref:hypothetical protein n=1 Tax=Melittangium boletus TaxID=83453 RepID=UPI003DA50B03